MKKETKPEKLATTFRFMPNKAVKELVKQCRMLGMKIVDSGFSIKIYDEEVQVIMALKQNPKFYSCVLTKKFFQIP